MRNIMYTILLLSSTNVYSEVITDNIIDSWNYTENNKGAYLHKFCDEPVMAQTVEHRSIKSKSESIELPGVYYRLTLGKEVYSSIVEAEKRVNEINNPKRRTTKHSKMCDIREAFNIGVEVHFVHTDVGAFRQEAHGILNKLFKSVSQSSQ